MNKICIIVNDYPNEINHNKLVFVKQLALKWTDMGIDCLVICPIATNIHREYSNLKYQYIETTKKGNKITILFPRFFGFGQKRRVFGLRLARLTTFLFTRCAYHAYLKSEFDCDAFYAHFLLPSGICASYLGKKFNKPSFFAYGESTTNDTIKEGGAKYCSNKLKNITGVISVSTDNAIRLCNERIIKKDQIGIFPNGFDKDVFYPMDKSIARRQVNLPNDKFIVGFVGSFDERKGIKRLEEAIDKINNPNIVFVAIGSGKLKVESKFCLFSGEVNHENLVKYYNSMDLFVLPTRNEGCCNAIIESIACGIPIVSSNLSFNDDILQSTFSLRCNIDSIDEIAKAIQDVYLRKVIFKKQDEIDFSKKLFLENRSQNILCFMKNMSKEEKL